MDSFGSIYSRACSWVGFYFVRVCLTESIPVKEGSCITFFDSVRIPFVVVCNYLNLVNEFVFPHVGEEHGSKQPLWELEPGCSPEIDAINVCRYCLSRHLDYKVVLERIEILLVSWTDTLSELLEFRILEELIDNLVLVQVKIEGPERTCA